MQGNRDENKGFTMIEVLIAIVILAVAIMAWISTQQSAVMGRGQSRTMTVAAELVQAKIEKLSIRPSEVCNPDDSCDGEDDFLIGGFEYSLLWSLNKSADFVPDSRAFWDILVEARWNYRGVKKHEARRIVMERPQ